MARGDVVSDWELSVSTGGYVSIQPASGDEWLVTHMGGSGATATMEVQMPTVANALMTALHAGETGVAEIADVIYWGNAKLLLTNAEYFRVRQDSGGTTYFVYSALKTKD
jgi:hypothetical protein